MTDLIYAVGKTPEGRLVARGIYAFYETNGLPLDIIIDELWKKNALPDWQQLIIDMVIAGRSRNHSIDAIVHAIQDAGCYPEDFSSNVIERLVMHREK